MIFGCGKTTDLPQHQMMEKPEGVQKHAIQETVVESSKKKTKEHDVRWYVRAVGNSHSIEASNRDGIFSKKLIIIQGDVNLCNPLHGKFHLMYLNEKR